MNDGKIGSSLVLVRWCVRTVNFMVHVLIPPSRWLSASSCHCCGQCKVLPHTATWQHLRIWHKRDWKLANMVPNDVRKYASECKSTRRSRKTKSWVIAMIKRIPIGNEEDVTRYRRIHSISFGLIHFRGRRGSRTKHSRVAIPRLPRGGTMLCYRPQTTVT